MFRISTILLIFLLAKAVEGLSQNRLFETDEILTVKIVAPLNSLIADRSEDAPAQPAEISYKEGKERVKIKAELEVRGNYRRRADICAFPPIKLKIKKKDRQATIFESQKTLKLVTHCQGEKYVLHEYMVYKFYNMLSPNSYRVRLAKIQYRDTERVMPPTTAYAFFIEHDRTLEKRLGGKEIAEEVAVPVSEISRKELTLIHMFQFMIGNLDWGITRRKNMTLIRVEESQRVIAVPYDFDFAACVQAPYTGLEKEFNRRNFRKICRTKEEYQELFSFFRQKRADLERLFLGFKLVPKDSREEALAYLNEFYAMIEDEKVVKDIFLDACPESQLNEDKKQ